MRELLTPEDICNEISMGRAAFDGVYLVVEGVTDSRLYGKFLDKRAATVIVAHSRDNAEKTVREMSRNRRDGRVIGIVDADLDLLKGRRAEPPLFRTDKRDLETMIISSGALDDVVDEYGDTEKVGRFEERRGSIREAVLDASYPIGLLMFISAEMGLGLSFKDLDFRRFIDSRTLSLDARAMVSEVVDSSANHHVSERELFSLLSDRAHALDDRWKAARGHDAVSILLMGLRDGFGSYNAHRLDEGGLGGALRLAFSDADFASTRLYEDTSEWSKSVGATLWAVSLPGNPLS